MINAPILIAAGLVLAIFAIIIYWYYCIFQINRNILPRELANKVNRYVWLFIFATIVANIFIYFLSSFYIGGYRYSDFYQAGFKVSDIYELLNISYIFIAISLGALLLRYSSSKIVNGFIVSLILIFIVNYALAPINDHIHMVEFAYICSIYSLLSIILLILLLIAILVINLIYTHSLKSKGKPNNKHNNKGLKELQRPIAIAILIIMSLSAIIVSLTIIDTLYTTRKLDSFDLSYIQVFMKMSIERIFVISMIALVMLNISGFKRRALFFFCIFVIVSFLTVYSSYINYGFLSTNIILHICHLLLIIILIFGAFNFSISKKSMLTLLLYLIVDISLFIPLNKYSFEISDVYCSATNQLLYFIISLIIMLPMIFNKNKKINSTPN
ncbi:hypothetical protein [Francisella philomiragia]|uniref:hypothetical protein n=1 Tax=Francisella philomiragia TaxID=28110 RepID=UPI0019073D85|nr:hypothetical protein [Francisella philomiragia]MBK2268306.1 hypothetical protein [Francisella philomiragia]MBK2279699.1 hypothetical protein [Francisella philomiragia]MBK2287617.1 hypothetical protein [Francisella philomiragia]MBK2289596.1 hypothetical protein [Francisella philomiragia]MBK2291494.1 hypothetical protein [Francisella philomiragia]